MCYDGSGDVIVCPPPDNALAQDGSYSSTAPSYVDNLNGTVTDNLTGLLWQQEDDGLARSWDQAMQYCVSLSLGGYSGWRLPSKRELHSIVNYGIATPGPTINNIFINTKANYYWSSTQQAYDPATAWAVSFYAGYVFYNSRNLNYYVRCVRGEQPTSRRFVDNGNGTVTDSNTGLMWQQGEDRSMSWEEAISGCERLSLGGHSDWRLPNIKELESLTDHTRYGPSIDGAVFPDAHPFLYWSSTTYSGDPSYAWYVVFQYGSVGNSGNKFKSYHVRCVRSGWQRPVSDRLSGSNQRNLK
ncbi:MAG TPA: DUF1566 domain-containing protein [Thermodesulfovibrionales bacterium]|nr:DUF1566 domain-containing protein [Thermodesulfovibrionales bacterium]